MSRANSHESRPRFCNDTSSICLGPVCVPQRGALPTHSCVTHVSDRAPPLCPYQTLRREVCRSTLEVARTPNTQCRTTSVASSANLSAEREGYFEMLHGVAFWALIIVQIDTQNLVLELVEVHTAIKGIGNGFFFLAFNVIIGFRSKVQFDRDFFER
jgi:hypothetical protein